MFIIWSLYVSFEFGFFSKTDQKHRFWLKVYNSGMDTGKDVKISAYLDCIIFKII